MKKKPERVRTPRNYVQTNMSFEPVTDKVSLTIPDQTMSIRQLIDRAQVTPIDENAFLGEDLELNQIADVDRMELTDRNELGAKLSEKTKGLSDKAKRDREKRERDELRKSILQEEKDNKPDEKPGGSPDHQIGSSGS